MKTQAPSAGAGGWLSGLPASQILTLVGMPCNAELVRDFEYMTKLGNQQAGGLHALWESSERDGMNVTNLDILCIGIH